VTIVLGLDIGGANTKAAYLSTARNKIEELTVKTEYFPFWKNKNGLCEVLVRLKKELVIDKLDAVAVTMTAELSDAYQTKREGVEHILGCVHGVFGDLPVWVLNTDARMQSLKESLDKPLQVASANWAATGWMVAQQIRNCVVVDVGSTSTSIIPVVDGQVAAEGKTDLEKLQCGELVYTGSLRTNIAAIVDSVPVKNKVTAVSSELFALSGDVHLILGNITQKEYTTETADGRGKTKKNAYGRLAKVVCADTDMLTQNDLITIAEFICEKQVAKITTALKQVYSRVQTVSGQKVPLVITGLGKDFLAKQAALSINVNEIVDLEELMGKSSALASPAVSVALMLAYKLEGNCT
jgi:(4-(4-[2-(gamma-L-glutamylamino)ethyl]phenoxymethyl)furan-2-yl)methanamine synthase